jgi:hypothetical protein
MCTCRPIILSVTLRGIVFIVAYVQVTVGEDFKAEGGFLVGWREMTEVKVVDWGFGYCDR